MQKIDQFTRGYIKCALWSSMDNSDDQGGSPLDQNYTESDISPETLAKIISDCDTFKLKNSTLLEKFTELYSPNGDFSPIECAGHDFWLTRCGHGSGFWDRGIGQVGDLLSDASKKFRCVDLYVGQDGKIYSY